MTAKLFNIIALSTLLSACATTPYYEKPQPIDVSQLTDCRAVEIKLEYTQNVLEHLASQNKRTGAGNALTVGASLLALNPLMLFELRNNNKITETVEAYEKQKTELLARKEQLCPPANHTLQAAEASAANL